MPIRPKLLLAGALVALAAAGCSSASPGDGKAGESAAVGTDTKAAESQEQQAQTLAENAQKIMLDPELPPRQKYPKALGMFREALKIDPTNALAKDGVKLIEDVYRSMGRPVPQAT